MTDDTLGAETPAPAEPPKKPLTLRKALRGAAIALALFLIAGELIRSFGSGRHILYIFGDIWMGLLLLAGAVLFGKDTLRRRALFAAGWGTCAGLLYGSFVGKLLTPHVGMADNVGSAVMTLITGIALGVALIGLVAVLLLPGKGKSGG